MTSDPLGVVSWRRTRGPRARFSGRRRRYASFAVVVALVFGSVMLSPRAGAVVSRGSMAGNSDVQIVAHQDDDFLFMNPDVQDEIGVATSPGFSSFNVVTVYMTAGEANGVNDHCPTTNPCWESLAYDRQQGIRAAYAHMAGLSPDSNGGYDSYWSYYLWQPDGVHWVEVYELAPYPQIQLIFMDLRDDGDASFCSVLKDPQGNDITTPDQCAASGGTWWDRTPEHELYNLFSTPGFQAPMIIPQYSALASVPSSQLVYDHAGVLTVLGAIFNRFQPHIVRTLDPQPYQIYSNQNPPKYYVSFDNTDHTMTARFTDLAMSTYNGPFGLNRATLMYYKGYSIGNYPWNLGDADYNAKSGTALTYQPYDNLYQHNDYSYWYHIMQVGYPSTTQWVARFGGGKLAAFSGEGGRVLMWHETVPGGSWSGPAALGQAGPFASSVTAVRRPDGALQLFVLRLPLDPTAPEDMMTAVVRLGKTFPGWTSIGAPNSNGCLQYPNSSFVVSGCFGLGVPTAAVDGAGQIFVFVRGNDGLLYYKDVSSTSSRWVAMTPSPTGYGTDSTLDILDGIAAATGSDGRIQVFATERGGGMQHHVEDISSQTFTDDYFFPPQSPLGNAASSPTLARTAGGQLELFYREAATGRVITYVSDSAGKWTQNLLYGDSGVGPVAAITRGTGEIMLFERNVWHGVSTLWEAAPNSGGFMNQSQQWTILGGYLEEYPGAAVDSAGRAVLVVKGEDGRLYLSRESSSIGSFGAWTPIGR